MEILGLLLLLAVIALVVYVVIMIVQLLQLLAAIIVGAAVLAMAGVGHVYAIRYVYGALRDAYFGHRASITILGFAAACGVPLGIACRLYNTLHLNFSDDLSLTPVYILVGLGVLPMGGMMAYFFVQHRRLLRERNSYSGYIIRGDGW